MIKTNAKVFVKDAKDLSKSDLVTIVEQLRAWLYLDTDEDDNEIWNPDKEWDSAADFIEFAALELQRHDLIPRESLTMVEAYDLLDCELRRRKHPNNTLYMISHYIHRGDTSKAELEFVRDSDKLGESRSLVVRVLRAIGVDVQ